MAPNVKADIWMRQVPADSPHVDYELGYLPRLLVNMRIKCLQNTAK
jgi:hypothetical protein